MDEDEDEEQRDPERRPRSEQSGDHDIVNAVAAVAIAADLALQALRTDDRVKADAALSLLLDAANDVARLRNPAQ